MVASLAKCMSLKVESHLLMSSPQGQLVSVLPTRGSSGKGENSKWSLTEETMLICMKNQGVKIKTINIPFYGYQDQKNV